MRTNFNHIFHHFIEVIYWMFFAFNKMLLTTLVGGIIIYVASIEWNYLLVFAILGGIYGILYAEKIRKRYGCAKYWALLISTTPPDATENTES